MTTMPNGGRRNLFQMAGAGLLVSAAGGAAAQATSASSATPTSAPANPGPQAAPMAR